MAFWKWVLACGQVQNQQDNQGGIALFAGQFCLRNYLQRDCNAMRNVARAGTDT
jgi:hypothetical protein